MKRTNVVVLTLSHLTLFLVGAAVFAGYRVRSEFEAASLDPLHRVAVSMAKSQTDTSAARVADADLDALSKTIGPRTSQVISLVGVLRQGRLVDAEASCSALGWPRCDEKALLEMRKVLGP